ncbi:MAG: efflux RND transporter periplasmic adaptor subunit [Candidatus Obscuribacterales bacterium]|nr:efflux RND transporter periplasmic adaptor subunit [Candidatus Obscuribacterales bacterium]
MNDQIFRIRKSRKEGKAMLFIIIFVLIIGGLFAVGIMPKLEEKKVLNSKEELQASAIPVVNTIKVEAAPAEESVAIPGNIGAMQYATIYARVDGYLKSRIIDIGDSVKEGQLLAEIDTPTIDEEIAQAAADLAQAKAEVASARSKLKEAKAQADTAASQIKKAEADQSYAAVTADRWQNMAERGAVSLQSRDEKNRSLAAQNASLEEAKSQKRAADEAVGAAASQVLVAEAGVLARKASLDRYKVQQSFKYIKAPFDGVITVRKVDPGALITAGSQSANMELFQLAKLDLLRIYIDAPQSIARYLKPGQKAELTVPSYPERTFTGTVTNVSGALDPQTRTRQTEIKIENPDHALLPGMYAQVKLSAERPETWVRVPSSAVIPKNGDLDVFVVRDGKAHLQKIVVGRDFGDETEIKAGLDAGSEVIVSPPDDLREDDPVQSAEIASK